MQTLRPLHPPSVEIKNPWSFVSAPLMQVSSRGAATITFLPYTFRSKEFQTSYFYRADLIR